MPSVFGSTNVQSSCMELNSKEEVDIHKWTYIDDDSHTLAHGNDGNRCFYSRNASMWKSCLDGKNTDNEEQNSCRGISVFALETRHCGNGNKKYFLRRGNFESILY